MPSKHLKGLPLAAGTSIVPAREFFYLFLYTPTFDIEPEISVTGYHQFSQNSALAHWKRLPTPPSDYRELRKRY